MKLLLLFYLVINFGALLAVKNPLEEFVQANNKFTLSLYQEVLKGDCECGNILVSPLSIEIILALTQSGAKGTTREEILKGLNLPNDQSQIREAILELNPLLSGNDEYTFGNLNKIYVNNSLAINANFENVTTEVFLAQVDCIDFTQNLEAVNTINQWVEEQTGGQVKDLLAPDSLDPSTEALLINALYFKGNWSIPFDISQTRSHDFHLNDTEVVPVDTMHFTQSVNFFQDDELSVKFLELEFQGCDVTMTFVLPNEPNGLGTVEENLEQVLTRPPYEIETVQVALPKFQIDARIDLKPVLENLGVNQIFEDSADLSGIAGEPGDLKIGEVVQKVAIDLGEQGVDVAVATGVAIESTSLQTPPPHTKEFIACHPFIFYIKVDDIVAFIGRVVAPDH